MPLFHFCLKSVSASTLIKSQQPPAKWGITHPPRSWKCRPLPASWAVSHGGGGGVSPELKYTACLDQRCGWPMTRGISRTLPPTRSCVVLIWTSQKVQPVKAMIKSSLTLDERCLINTLSLGIVRTDNHRTFDQTNLMTFWKLLQLSWMTMTILVFGLILTKVANGVFLDQNDDDEWRIFPLSRPTGNPHFAQINIQHLHVQAHRHDHHHHGEHHHHPLVTVG